MSFFKTMRKGLKGAMKAVHSDKVKTKRSDLMITLAFSRLCKAMSLFRAIAPLPLVPCNLSTDG